MKGFKIDHKVVDGADETQKELRNELFSISGTRGKYPQIFLTNKTDKTEFVGDFAAIQTLVENNDVNVPGVQNFRGVFECAKLT
jgi:hypothetical protein